MAVGVPSHSARSEPESLTPRKMGLSGECGPISHSWLPCTRYAILSSSPYRLLLNFGKNVYFYMYYFREMSHFLRDRLPRITHMTMYCR